MKELKYVTYKHLKKGQKIDGALSDSSKMSFVGYVKEVNAAYVIIEMWEPGGMEEKYSSEWLYGIELTDEEFREKYNAIAGEVVTALQNRMNRDEIGSHEMANGWLQSDPWEMACACYVRKYIVLGHCNDIIPKQSFLGGEPLDAGVCVEDEDGDRFWCHFRSETIEIMARRYEKYQRLLKEGRAGEYDSFEVEWEYMEEKEKKNAD